MFPCLMTKAENSHARRVESGNADVLRDLAVGCLMVEFMAATLDPLRVIKTPGFRPEGMRLVDVVFDELCGKDSDAVMTSLVSALTKSPEGLEWLRQRARDYAEFHADDEVNE